MGVELIEGLDLGFVVVLLVEIAVGLVVGQHKSDSR